VNAEPRILLTPETLAACKEVWNINRHSVHQIIDAVADATGIEARAILGKRRDAPIARARQIVMYEARQRGLSLSQIGNALGRDHTTVMHGIREEEKRRGK
jgi:chromosomal replication initiation ATPase DnaA